MNIKEIFVAFARNLLGSLKVIKRYYKVNVVIMCIFFSFFSVNICKCNQKNEKASDDILSAISSVEIDTTPTAKQYYDAARDLMKHEPQMQNQKDAKQLLANYAKIDIMGKKLPDEEKLKLLDQFHCCPK